jgi:hypothetical protein
MCPPMIQKLIVIVYRFLKISAGMMSTNEIEHHMQRWNYIKIVFLEAILKLYDVCFMKSISIAP